MPVQNIHQNYIQYRSLSTSREDGNVGVGSAGTSGFSYSYLSTSRGAGNLFCWQVRCHFNFCIATYLPREGPETVYQIRLRLSSSPSSIDTHIPREGPETIILSSKCKGKRYRYLSTSRGAGNPNPASSSSLRVWCIATYLPREGPETRFGLYF